jgi:galactokinase
VPPERSRAFAPGRVNLIGEHTDYNQGLALPFAIGDGITVSADALPPDAPGDGEPAPGGRQAPGGEWVHAFARDLNERDEFALAAPGPASGWRAFVRGTVAELARAGLPLVGASLQISGQLPPGAGLSSSAALEVALCLALIELGAGGVSKLNRTDIARLCSRVENDWVGAHTGLLDQLASLYGEPDAALCIDFRTLDVQPVPLLLGDWRLVVLDSGERHQLANSGYNQRRAECAQACRLLGVDSLRDAEPAAVEQLPETLRRRALHVLGENQRARVRDRAARRRPRRRRPPPERLPSEPARELRGLHARRRRRCAAVAQCRRQRRAPHRRRLRRQRARPVRARHPVSLRHARGAARPRRAPALGISRRDRLGAR